MVAFGWALVAAAFLGRVDLAVAVLIMGRDLWYTAEHEARHHHECGILQYMRLTTVKSCETLQYTGLITITYCGTLQYLRLATTTSYGTLQYISGTKSGGGFKFPQGLALNDLNLLEKTSARRLGIGS